MGLFSRKPKEYVFDQKTGCAVCKQSIEHGWHYIISFFDGETARNEIVLQYRVHDSATCLNRDFIKKSQPAGTTLVITKAIKSDYVLKMHRMGRL
jgi:hypothetical protein